jgi:hypothetical protein
MAPEAERELDRNENGNDSTPGPTDERLGNYVGPVIHVQYPSSFCDNCEKLLVGHNMGTVPFADIQKSALDQSYHGCESCRVLTALLRPHIGPWADDDAEIEVEMMESDDRFVDSPLKLRLTNEGSEKDRLVEIFWPSEYVDKAQVKGGERFF